MIPPRVDPRQQQQWQYRGQPLPGGLRPFGADGPGTWGNPRGGWQSPSSDFRGPQFQQVGAPTINDVPFALRQIGVGGAESGAGGEAGRATAGQPGSAGEGWGKTISDFGMSLAGGMLAPGFGTMVAGARALTDPNFDPFGFNFGPAPPTHPTPAMIEDMTIQPGTYGLDTASVARSGQMTQDEPSRPGNIFGGDPINVGPAGGGDLGGRDPGAGIGGGPGGGGAANTGGAVGGEAGFGGGYARGGIVRGRGGIDSQRISATPGEGVLNPGAMRMLGPHTLYMLNAMGSRR